MTSGDVYKIEGPACISFSGGRTSAYMLYKILQAWSGKLPDDVVVCFANTGKEMEETLRFVDKCSKEWSVPITWVEFKDNDQKYKIVNFETASRNGEPFEELIIKRKFLPNPVSRFCTVELKVRTIHRYLKSIGFIEWDSVLGIRADEQRRMAKIGNQDYGKHETKVAPLGNDGVTSNMVGNFWASQSFDLELPNMNGVTMHGNCDLCFLKGAKQVQSLIAENPERAIWWAKAEALVQSSGYATGQGGRFRKDRPSYQQMYDFAKQQQDWIKNSSQDETIPCFCGD